MIPVLVVMLVYGVLHNYLAGLHFYPTSPLSVYPAGNEPGCDHDYAYLGFCIRVSAYFMIVSSIIEEQRLIKAYGEI
jgi:hypothetical protein